MEEQLATHGYLNLKVSILKLKKKPCIDSFKKQKDTHRSRDASLQIISPHVTEMDQLEPGHSDFSLHNPHDGEGLITWTVSSCL